MKRFLAAAFGVMTICACSPRPAAGPTQATQAAAAHATAAVTAAIDPREIQIAEVGTLPGGYPQGPEQGELFTTRDQVSGVPVLVMPVAPDRLGALLGSEPDQVQMLIIPLVDERRPAGAAEADATSETLVPSPANAIEAYGDPFAPPKPILESLPTRP